MSSKLPKHLSIKECASASGKSASTIRNWIKQGKVKTKSKKHKNSKVMVERDSLMALLHTSAQPTISGSGVSKDNRLANVDALKQKIRDLEESLRLLELVSKSDKQMITNYQHLISSQKELIEARENENARIHKEFMVVKSDYQLLLESNNQLTTRLSHLNTYLSLPWWKKLSSSLLLEDKSPTKASSFDKM